MRMSLYGWVPGDATVCELCILAGGGAWGWQLGSAHLEVSKANAIPI